jgi:hypothetical protein
VEGKTAGLRPGQIEGGCPHIKLQASSGFCRVAFQIGTDRNFKVLNT